MPHRVFECICITSFKSFSHIPLWFPCIFSSWLPSSPSPFHMLMMHVSFLEKNFYFLSSSLYIWLPLKYIDTRFKGHSNNFGNKYNYICNHHALALFTFYTNALTQCPPFFFFFSPSSIIPHSSSSAISCFIFWWERETMKHKIESRVRKMKDQSQRHRHCNVTRKYCKKKQMKKKGAGEDEREAMREAIQAMNEATLDFLAHEAFVLNKRREGLPLLYSHFCSLPSSSHLHAQVHPPLNLVSL